MTSPVQDAVEARPWQEGDGPRPVVVTWPRTDPPALFVRIAGTWRRASVTARQDWPDGRVMYQVAVAVKESAAISHRTYAWPQNGLRVAHHSAAQPTTKAGLGGDMPTPPRRVKLV
ncbi:hypothetical protein [Streptomyces sp. Tue6028]|uniref:hypothetical protein n=1 Tax=Streptomyces sp. Tue6028 TaxID=2036037 RepID=UPI003D70E09F